MGNYIAVEADPIPLNQLLYPSASSPAAAASSASPFRSPEKIVSASSTQQHHHHKLHKHHNKNNKSEFLSSLHLWQFFEEGEDGEGGEANNGIEETTTTNNNTIPSSAPSGEDRRRTRTQPVRLGSTEVSQAFHGFNKKHCYVALHISLNERRSRSWFSARRNHGSSASAEELTVGSGHNNGGNSETKLPTLASLLRSSEEALTPRGLASCLEEVFISSTSSSSSSSSSSSGSSLHPSSAIALPPVSLSTASNSSSSAPTSTSTSPRAVESSSSPATSVRDAGLIYNIYLWNGRDSNKFTRAVALAKSFELEKVLKSEGRRLTEQLFKKGEKVPLTAVFKHDLFGNHAFSLNENGNPQNNHLYRQLLKRSFPERHLGKTKEKKKKTKVRAKEEPDPSSTSSGGNDISQQQTENDRAFPFFKDVFGIGSGDASGSNSERGARTPSSSNSSSSSSITSSYSTDKDNKRSSSSHLSSPKNKNGDQQLRHRNNNNHHHHNNKSNNNNADSDDEEDDDDETESSATSSYTSSTSSSPSPRRKHPPSHHNIPSLPTSLASKQSQQNKKPFSLALGSANNSTNNNRPKFSLPIISRPDFTGDDDEDGGKRGERGGGGNIVPTTSRPDLEFYQETENNIKSKKLKKYDSICSQITERLYLGSETVSKDLPKLKEVGITHILNCAGSICDNWFPKEFEYRTLYLMDGVTEDITCLFYDIIEWIENIVDPNNNPIPTSSSSSSAAASSSATSTRKNKQPGKLLIHCQQGVSRSSAMMIGYLMWKNDWEYDRAQMYVKMRRGVSSPNAGFICQLIILGQRLRENSNSSSNNNNNKTTTTTKKKVESRLYYIVSHSRFDPTMLVAKRGRKAMLLSHIHSTDSTNAADKVLLSSSSSLKTSSSLEGSSATSTGMASSGSISTVLAMDPSDSCFIVQTPEQFFIWVGKSCSEEYRGMAEKTVRRVQFFEKSGWQSVNIVREGEETREFKAALLTCN